MELPRHGLGDPEIAAIACTPKLGMEIFKESPRLGELWTR